MQHNPVPKNSTNATRRQGACCKLLTLQLSLLSLSLAAFAAISLSADAQARGRAGSSAHRVSTAVRPKTTNATPTASAAANVALLAQGAKLHKEGRIEEAEAIFKEVLIRDPHSVDAFYDLGAIAEGRGDLISALSHYHAALSMRPGDKELKEAVASVEKSLTKKNDNKNTDNKNTEVAGKKSAPLSIVPEQKPTSNTEVKPVDGKPVKEQIADAPSKNIDNIEGFAPSGSNADAALLTVVPAEKELEQGLPVLSFPQAETEQAPKVIDTKTFQLSSRKGEVITPSLGIAQDQFPDIPLKVKGAATNNCPPPPVLAVGQNQRSQNGQRMRQAASLIIMVGAGAALNATGLHCPVCHMMRLRF